MIRKLTLFGAMCALLISASAAEAATDSLWTPVNSGTADTYRVVVRETTLKGKKVGKPITFKFTLK